MEPASEVVYTSGETPPLGYLTPVEFKRVWIEELQPELELS
jgi:hypothetical protein